MDDKLSRPKRSFLHLFDDTAQYASIPAYNDWGADTYYYPAAAVAYYKPIDEESVIVHPTKKRLFVPNFWG